LVTVGLRVGVDVRVGVGVRVGVLVLVAVGVAVGSLWLLTRGRYSLCGADVGESARVLNRIEPADKRATSRPVNKSVSFIVGHDLYLNIDLSSFAGQ